VFDGYESACTIAVVITTIPRFAGDQSTTWWADYIPCTNLGMITAEMQPVTEIMD